MSATSLPTDLLAALRFDAAGLVPAVCVDAVSGRVLMLAWMDDRMAGRPAASGCP